MGLKDFAGKIAEFYAERYQKMAGIEVAGPCPPLAEMLDVLTALPDEVYGRYAFHREPLRGKVPEAERDRLILHCQAEGDRCAHELREEFGSLRPSELAAHLHLSVDRPVTPVGGGRVLFAEFEEPDKIRVYQSAVSRAREAIAEQGLEAYFHGIDIEEILIAHELYHWVEQRYAHQLFSRNHTITLWTLGPYRHTAHLACLSEITAMRFAKALTGLPCSPFFLDMFISYTYQPEAGAMLYHELQQTAAESPSSFSPKNSPICADSL